MVIIQDFVPAYRELAKRKIKSYKKTLSMSMQIRLLGVSSFYLGKFVTFERLRNWMEKLLSYIVVFVIWSNEVTNWHH